MNEIWDAYLRREGALEPFFTIRPGDWSAAAEARRRAPARPLGNEAVEEIARANEAWGVARGVIRRAVLLSLPETRVVATGQQAGLLGGPLYTLYKAIAVVRWAAEVERQLGQPVVPIFWIVSQDHDFDEVRSFRWSRPDGSWQQYRYQPTGHRPGMPVHDIAVEPHLRDDLDRIFAELRQTEYTSGLRQTLCAIAAESADLEALFVRTLAWLLGERAPLFISPRMQWVRRGASAIFERELGQPGQTSRLVIEAGQRLAALGFTPQLHRRPEDVNAFLYRDGLRCKVVRANEGFLIISPEGEKQTVEAESLRRELVDHPDHFSLNVVTRSLVQDYLLPTLAYVAGPGEVAYFAQMREVYQLLGVAMPMILPRPSVCLIEPRVERAAQKLGLDIGGAVAASPSQLEGLLEQATRQGAVEERLRDAKRRLNEALETARSSVDLDDPAVAKAFEKLTEMINVGFEKLAERQRKAVLSHDQATARAAATVRESLAPDGIPQERALTVFFPFLNLFGPALVQHVFEAIGLDAGGDVQPILLSSLLSGEKEK